MAGNENRRETGATKYPNKDGGDHQSEFSQDAAGNNPPDAGGGLARPVGEVEDTTHQSDGQNSSCRPTPSPATQKTSGAGPAVAEHSKDAKAPRSGRQPGAYRKD